MGLEDRKSRILIVDDTNANLKTLSAALKDEYSLSVATTGEEALEFLWSNIRGGSLPDLVLLDIMMPGIDGYEVCRRMKQEEALRNIPVIFITAKGEEEDETRGFSIGAVDFITKPFSIPVVKVRVGNQIQLKKYKDYLQDMVEKRTEELKSSYERLRETNIAYERFVPKEILSLLGKEDIVHVELGNSVEKSMTVLFSDIRQFATLSEHLGPSETFRFLNDYLGTVVPVIRKYNGFVDKYIGDAVLALFPRDPADALDAASEMQRVVHMKYDKGDSGLPLRIGIGLHYGDVMLGTIGEPNRIEGTVIADAVNLTSRLEQLTKTYGADIVMSDAVYEQLDPRGRHEIRFLDTIQVRGKVYPVSIYEVIDRTVSDIAGKKIELKQQYEDAWSLFCEGRIEEAHTAFSDLCRKNSGDKAAELFLSRCMEYFQD